MSFSHNRAESYKKYEFKKFCHNVGFEQVQIAALLDNISGNYKQWSEKKIDKAGKVKTYKDGTEKERHFKVPSTLLKAVQSRIKTNILSKIKLPKVVHGGVKKRSNITNAKQHQGKKYIFCTDLQEFFPNVNSKKVYDALINLNFSSHFAHCLTELTTFKEEVPQGAPTSSHICNLVFLQTDIKLINLCKLNKISYTRYVDDLTFSSQKDFAQLIGEIISIIIAAGFKVSHRKTKYSADQIVTGIAVFLHKIDGPEKLIQKSIVEIETNADKKYNTIYLNSIRKTNKKKNRVK